MGVSLKLQWERRLKEVGQLSALKSEANFKPDSVNPLYVHHHGDVLV